MTHAYRSATEKVKTMSFHVVLTDPANPGSATSTKNIGRLHGGGEQNAWQKKAHTFHNLREAADLPSIMSSPEESTAGTLPDNTSMQPTATNGGDNDSASDIDWEGIAFFLLGILGLFLLFTLIFVWRRAPKNRGTADHADDVEARRENDPQLAHDSESTAGCLPNGIASLLPFCAAVIATCLSIVPHTSCDFMDLYEDGTIESIGLWRNAYERDGSDDFGGENQCYSHFRNFPEQLDKFDVDPALKVARAFAILASTLGGLCMLVLLFTCVSSRLGVSAVRCMAVPLLLTAIFQALTLSALGTDYCESSNSCELGMGFTFSIEATFYWMLCAFGVLVLPLKGA
jgi:hypothetical protein